MSVKIQDSMPVDETMTIPKNHFVTKVDLDCEEPCCIICNIDFNDKK